MSNVILRLNLRIPFIIHSLFILGTIRLARKLEFSHTNPLCGSCSYSFLVCSSFTHFQTSVLCGIMRLSILQIMLGTLPVIVLIIPSCLTGSLLYMASLVTDTGNPVFDWAGTLSTITASVTAVVQFASMIVAAYYLEQASDKYASEISAIDDDIEVKEADARDEHVRECYKKVTQWNALPMAPKLLLSCSLASITASCYMVSCSKNWFSAVL